MIHKSSYVDPISNWFLIHAVSLDDSTLGREMAVEMMRQFRKQFPHAENMVVRGYLNGWNARSFKPFPADFINALINMQFTKERKKQKASPEPESFAMPLFDERAK